MWRLLCLTCFVSVAAAQTADDARTLLHKAYSVAAGTTNWQAEAVRNSKISGAGTNLEDEVHIKIAVDAPLKVRRENSGGDHTVLICDGTDSFYSGDGHSYYKNSAKANPDCSFTMISLYQSKMDPASASVVGRDHVLLADGNRECDLVRAERKLAAGSEVRTMCIDTASGLILRDVLESEDEKGAMRTVVTTTLLSYQSHPRFSPDTFHISIPPGAVEAKPPI